MKKIALFGERPCKAPYINKTKYTNIKKIYELKKNNLGQKIIGQINSRPKTARSIEHSGK